MHIKNSIKKLFDIYLQNPSDAQTIFFVGSNYNKKECNEIKSDIDLIVLSPLKTQQLFWNFEGLNYDITILNDNDILHLSYFATNGNFIFSKILSSMTSFTIIKSEHVMTEDFISIIQKLNTINKNSFIPNYQLITTYKHNIIVNYADYKDKLSFEKYFSEQRLLNQLFSYISYLLYPYQTQGSFQGKILQPYLQNFIPTNSTIKIDHTSIKNLIEKYSPYHKSIFLALEFDKETKLIIEEKIIRNFFFGYTDLFSEKTIVFINKNELKKIPSHLRLHYLQIVNEIPSFNDDDLKEYYNILCDISRDFYSKSEEQCLLFLNQTFSIFKENEIDNYITNSLKRIIIEKSAYALLKAEKSVSISTYNSLLNTLIIEPTEIKSINQKKNLKNIKLLLLKNTENLTDKEKGFRSVSLYFGIMKALRLKIENLSL